VLLFIALAWSALAFLKAVESRLQFHLRGLPTSFSERLLFELPIAAAGILATPLALWLAFRFPLNRLTWRRHCPVLLLGSAALVILMNLVRTPLWTWIEGGSAELTQLARQSFVTMSGVFHIDLLNVWFVMGAAHLLLHVKERQRRIMAAARLEAELANARLQVLRAQMQPHFLFNTLHTIGQLVRANRNRESLHVVELLGDLLRRSLHQSNGALTSLAEEIEFARRYLDIEQVRFADRLHVHWELDERALQAEVPSLFLQPLVENAIRHGIAPRSAAGMIRIRAQRQDGRVRITIQDDGPGFPASPNGGIGLANTRQRLALAYGEAAQVVLHNVPEGGAQVIVSLPFTRGSTTRSPVPEAP
jgi:signal transduction histidine kinase